MPRKHPESEPVFYSTVKCPMCEKIYEVPFKVGSNPNVMGRYYCDTCRRIAELPANQVNYAKLTELRRGFVSDE